MKLSKPMSGKDKQKGFTLVELIIVMAILAVLAGIAVPKFGTVLADSKDKADDANRAMITNAIELYYANEGTEPPAKSGGDVLDTLVDEGYLKEVPKEPKSNTEYSVASVTAGANGKLAFIITP